jgi:hypothetical protein
MGSMIFRAKTMLLGASFAFLTLAAAPGQAAQLDLRVGSYTDLDKLFAGAGFLSHVGGSIYLNPNVEYVFVDSGRYGTLNLDAHYDLPTHGRPHLWIGGGLALVHNNPEGEGGSTTDARGNLLVGLGLGSGRSIFYVQAKFISDDQFVAAAGIRF